MREITKQMIYKIGKIIKHKSTYSQNEMFITTITGISGDGEYYHYADCEYAGNRVKVDDLEEEFEIIAHLKTS